MPKMSFKNARNTEQLRRMKILAKNKACHFCGENFLNTHTSPIIFKNKNWFITANDFPYEGSTNHYLIVSNKHLTDFNKINKNAQIDFFNAVFWLEKHLKVRAFSLFIRCGDMSYTGATIDHLHFHFITGKKRDSNSKWLQVTVGYKN